MPHELAEGRGRARLRGPFALLVVLLGTIVTVGVLESRQINQSANHAYLGEVIPMRTAIRDLVLQMVNQETAVRGFLITADPAGLAPYQRGRQAAAADLAAINARASGNPLVEPLLVNARSQVDALETYFAAEVATGSTGQAGLAAARSRVDAGRQQFDGFRATADQMLAAMVTFTANAKRNQDNNADASTFILLGLGGAAMLVAVVLFVRVPRRVEGLVVELEAARNAHAAAAAAAEYERDVASALQRFAEALSVAVSVEDVSRVVRDHGLAVAGAHGGGVYLLDERREHLRLVASRQREGVSEGWMTIRRDVDAPVGDVTTTGTPILLGTAEQIDHAYPALRDLRLRAGDAAWATVPLTAAGETLGALAVTFAAPQPFNGAQRALLVSIAARVSEALERARLYDAERRARTRTEQFEHLAAELATAVGIAETARVMLEQGRSVAGASIGVVLFAEPERRGLAVIGSVGIDAATERRLAAAINEQPGAKPAFLTAGEPVWLPDATSWREVLPASAAVLGHALAAALLPLTNVGSASGALLLVFRQPVEFNAQERAFLVAVARQGGQALERARLNERQREIARTLQLGLLPRSVPEVPGLQIGVAYIAAGEGNDVGGDFYDVAAVPGGTAIVVGDVAGKGAAAARVTAVCRHAVRTAIHDGRLHAPTDIVRLVNSVVALELEPDEFCTLVYAQIDHSQTDTVLVTIANAGHLAPIVRRADRSIEALERRGPPLGVVDDLVTNDTQIVLGLDDTLLLYTDGVIDARNGNDRFGEARLVELVAGEALTASALVESLVAAIRAHARDTLPDDVAVLAVRYVGSAGRAGSPAVSRRAES